jgi:transposase
MTPEGSWKEEFEQLNRKIDGLSTLNEKLVSQVIKQSAQLSEVHDQSTTQTGIIEELTNTVAELKQIIISKDARISELEERLNKNSGNSSKPSSSDFFNKPKPSAINKGERGGKTKRSGGQKGHAGSTLKLKETPDVIHRCVPADCVACELADRCAGSVIESRNVVDVRIVSEQSRYDRIQRVCLKSGKTLAGSFPEGVNTQLQYGSHLKAMVVALSSFGMVSASRICELVEGLAGIRLSDGTVCNILSDCAGRCNALVPELKQHVIASDTAHFDETGIRVNGKVHWAHTSSTDKVTLISAHPKRGAEGILAGGVLQQFQGVAVHDCWGSYYHEAFKDITHAVCGAHIDRELEGVVQNHRQRWASSLKKLLGELYDAKRKLLATGIAAAPREMVQAFSKRYDRILANGFSRNPYQKPEVARRGKPKKGKVLSLLERLRELKDDVMRFFTDFRVPFSNNIGEKSFRLSKLKMKVAGSFRSADGGSYFCSIFSVIDTVRKNGGNPFISLVALFNNMFSLSFLN